MFVWRTTKAKVASGERLRFEVAQQATNQQMPPQTSKYDQWPFNQDSFLTSKKRYCPSQEQLLSITRAIYVRTQDQDEISTPRLTSVCDKDKSLTTVLRKTKINTNNDWKADREEEREQHSSPLPARCELLYLHCLSLNKRCIISNKLSHKLGGIWIVTIALLSILFITTNFYLLHSELYIRHCLIIPCFSSSSCSSTRPLRLL